MKLLYKNLTDTINVGLHFAKQLSENLGISTLNDLIHFFPYKYEDKSRTVSIESMGNYSHAVPTEGTITQLDFTSTKGKRRLVGVLKEGKSSLQLVWFNRIDWVYRSLQKNSRYYVFGQARGKRGNLSIVHPEMILITPTVKLPKGIYPIYSTSQKLVRRGIDNAFIAKIQKQAIGKSSPYIEETIPLALRKKYDLLERREALSYIHFSPSKLLLLKARRRLKVEELLYLQLYLLQRKKERNIASKGMVFKDTALLKKYYEEFLSFTLTDDQKKAIREICRDMRTGHQMNRLLQGDVGCGKTIIAFLSGLVPVSDGAQVAFLAPTEVLATQHFEKIKTQAENLDLSVALLTGSTPAKARKEILDDLSTGKLNMIVGTHALLEERVLFACLGLAVIDEQHRFGVAQRARIWQKNKTSLPPHVLVMTATPIPRTLAKALYGDLDVTLIKEKPLGRKPILTSHHYDRNRLAVFGRMREEIEKGHQVYVIYPRILSSKGEEIYKDVMDGYESISRAFPEIPISILHGKMSPTAKAFEMKRFVKGETKIMIGTTVLEVGVNVPNATMMVIENAESFGLAQLHQLRGRVGRDEKASYCLLLTKEKLSNKAYQRIQTMVRTEDGFEIAKIDLRSRGPGDILGVQQSGLYKMKLADLSKDDKLVEEAHAIAQDIVDEDPYLSQPHYAALKKIVQNHAGDVKWGMIS